MHPQAQQPLRRRDGRGSRDRLRAGLRGRPGQRLRRDRGAEPPGGPRRRPSGCACPGRFLEAILAPGFDEEALEWLTTKPTWRNSVRLIDLGAPDRPRRSARAGIRPPPDRGRPAGPGLGPARGRPGLRHRADPPRLRPRPNAATWPSPGGSAPRSSPTRSSWPRDGQIVGVGAGQMSRLDSVKIAVEKAGPRAEGLGPGLRRLLPLPRRPRRRRGRRRDRHHPARRLAARRRDHQGLRRARHRHDPHRPPPFPSLSGSDKSLRTPSDHLPPPACPGQSPPCRSIPRGRAHPGPSARHAAQRPRIRDFHESRRVKSVS